MIPPPPELTASALHRARQWSDAVTAALDAVTAQVGAAARRLADGWTDARGQEWTDRLHVVHRALERDADAAAALGRAADRLADDLASPAALDGGPSYGPLLGGTAGRRVDDRRGVTVPQLNDPADGPG
jgi:hypothetical protein